MKFLIKVALIALVAILAYNYFYGDEKEQKQAEKIVGKVKDLGADIKALVVNEKEKYDDGKYDDAVEKISELISSVKDKISSIDLKELEEKQQELKDAVEKLKDKTGKEEERQEEKVEEDMQRLFDQLKESLEKI